MNFHGKPAAAFLLEFCVNRVWIWAVRGKRSLVRWMQVSLAPEGWLSRVLGELHWRQRTRHRSYARQLSTQNHLIVVDTIDLIHSRVDEYQVHSPQLGQSPTDTDLLKVEYVRIRCSGETVSVLTQLANRRDRSESFWAWLPQYIFSSEPAEVSITGRVYFSVLFSVGE